MAPDPLAIGLVTDPADPRLDALLDLYVQAIPARERKDEADIRAMALSARQRIGVAMEDGKLIGFFLLYIGRSLALLEYLATAPALRGRGLGADLYRAARAQARPLPLLVEVESDRDSCADQTLRARRIHFYRRLGCRRIEDFDFVLPLPGKGPPPRLDLLVDEVDQPFGAERLGEWVREIYAGVYGCPADDPRLDGMLTSLPATLRLG